MKLTHEDISELYRRETQAPSSRPACPPDSSLQAAARGQASAAERRLVAEHMALCSTCTDVYLTAKRAPANPAEPAQRAQHHGRHRVRYRALQLAAVLTLCVGPAWWWLSQRQTTYTETSRGDTSSTINIPVEPADKARLSAPPSHLRWPPREGAMYQVVVFDRELERLWQSPELSVTEVELGESLRLRMTPGSAFYWRVIARIGIERHESPLHLFQIVAPESP